MRGDFVEKAYSIARLYRLPVFKLQLEYAVDETDVSCSYRCAVAVQPFKRTSGKFLRLAGGTPRLMHFKNNISYRIVVQRNGHSSRRGSFLTGHFNSHGYRPGSPFVNYGLGGRLGVGGIRQPRRKKYAKNQPKTAKRPVHHLFSPFKNQQFALYRKASDCAVQK